MRHSCARSNTVNQLLAMPLRIAPPQYYATARYISQALASPDQAFMINRCPNSVCNSLTLCSGARYITCPPHSEGILVPFALPTYHNEEEAIADRNNRRFRLRTRGGNCASAYGCGFTLFICLSSDLDRICQATNVYSCPLWLSSLYQPLQTGRTGASDHLSPGVTCTQLLRFILRNGTFFILS